MLTAHLNVGPGSILILGVTKEDLRELSQDRSCTLEGAQFGLPTMTIFVLPTADEGDFRTTVYGILDEVKGTMKIIEVQPADAAKVPS